MVLPHMKYSDAITKKQQVTFGGYNHSPYARDGAVYDMQNMSSDLYPLASPRKKREKVTGAGEEIYRGREYQFRKYNNTYTLSVPELIENGTYKRIERIKLYDIIQIYTDDELYKENNGKYLVTSTNAKNDYTVFTVERAFASVHDGEYNSSLPNAGDVGLNDSELSITIIKRADKTEENTETKVTILPWEVYGDSTVNEYSYTDDVLTHVKTDTTYERVSVDSIYQAEKTETVTTTEYKLLVHRLSIASIGADDRIYYVTDDGAFFYDGVFRGMLAAGDKQFAHTGAYLYILPDNAYYNTNSGEIKRSDSLYIKGYSSGVSFNGTTLTDNHDDSDFEAYKSGDVLTVRACTERFDTYIFKNAVIKAVSGNTITFTEDLIKRDCGEEATYKTLTGEDSMSRGWYSITITKGTPDLKYICADSNRIWGCDEKCIYCTSFGNPLGWFEYDVSSAGNDADAAWAVEPFDSAGEFTGCCIYNDRPMFFKENKVYTIYGSRASGYEAASEDTAGVSRGSAASIQVIDGILYYLSPIGIIRRSGNVPGVISSEFYEQFEEGRAGSCQEHYYISMRSGDVWRIFSYNVKQRIWCAEDRKMAKGWFAYERRLFMHDDENNIWCVNPDSDEYPQAIGTGGREKEKDIESFLESADFYINELDKKAPSKLYFRFLLEEESSAEILICYDSEEEDGSRKWQSVKTLTADRKKSFVVPMIPRRCDHFRLKIKGMGKWLLYGLSYEYYTGTAL